MVTNAKVLEAVHTHTHTHTHRINLSAELDNIVKLNLIYKKIMEKLE